MHKSPAKLIWESWFLWESVKRKYLKNISIKFRILSFKYNSLIHNLLFYLAFIHRAFFENTEFSSLFNSASQILSPARWTKWMPAFKRTQINITAADQTLLDRLLTMFLCIWRCIIKAIYQLWVDVAVISLHIVFHLLHQP